ncbi:hypothetical protein DRE_00290 [Drechslerella stenobrocha 248]|uniref:Uncharacterized protein n=1 Tax=Drechslerella stenobrocha 248 TaxID=1043628 RepID=W7I4E1_9PEZI|nr:hypothetical protein DRE_00290 [Drechslerella stenobrocha 248]
MAALKSIEASSDLFKSDENIGQDQRSVQKELLQVWLVLHKLLNDDEEDIRAAAADLTMKLLTTGPQQTYLLLTPPHAEKRLFEYLTATRAGDDAAVQQTLLEDILGLPPTNAKDIKEQLIAANTPNTLLFKIEKQNLYRDDLRCMEYSLNLLSTAATSISPSLSGSRPANQNYQALTRYVATGIETLSEIAQEYQVVPAEGGVSIDSGKLRAADGMMGWTTATEEMFVLGMRIANAFRLLQRWYSEGGEALRVKGVVQKLVDYGEREDVLVNAAWLNAFRLGLEDSPA